MNMKNIVLPYLLWICQFLSNGLNHCLVREDPITLQNIKIHSCCVPRHVLCNLLPVFAGQITVGNTMNLTLTCDHRTVDGAVGAQFLQTLKTFIENPVTMLA